MTAVAEEIYNEAINLNPIDKAELINKLYLSFSPKIDKSIENNWKEEGLVRHEAYNKGKIQADTLDNVFNRLSQR
jgi:hypothetical protein